MNSRRWGEPEIAKALGFHESGFPLAEIAAMLNRTESSVRLKFLSLGYSSRRIKFGKRIRSIGSDSSTFSGSIAQPDDSEPDEDASYYEQRAERELEISGRRREDRKMVKEAKQALLEDRIAAEFREHLHTVQPEIRVSVQTPSSPPLTPTRNPLTAVLVVGDVHGGQVVDPRETEGLGCYNPAIMLARLHLLEVEATRILAAHKIDRLLLLFAGDIIHGRLGHSLEDDLTLPLALQVDLMLHCLFPFIMSLSTAVPQLDIYGVAGNHGRWPGTRKMPSDRRWSNFDTMVYSALAALISHSSVPTITFDDRISSRRTIDAGSHRLQLLHGDEVRGGAFCTGGMNREVNNSTLRHVQRGVAPVDYYIMGDKHFTASVPFGTGAFVVNGSFVGLDSFGMNFIPAPPSQTLFFLDPALGKIETHEIRLDHAVLGKDLPHSLKPTLLELINKYRHE